MKKHSLLLTFVMITLIAISLPTPAAAKDAVVASVTDPQPDEALVALMVNGKAASPGTYAVGTIQMFFEMDKAQLESDPVAYFTLGLTLWTDLKSSQPTNYPVDVTLKQTGSQNVELDPETSNFTIPDAAWAGEETLVNVHVPASVVDAAQDGDDLVGNLQIVAPGGSHLDTPTTIQVHIKVVDPQTCITVYDFLTDMDFSAILTTTQVNVSKPNGNPNKPDSEPQVKSTNPGQLSDNILIVSQCAEPQTFDLQITLDDHFEVQGRNAVATYLAGGYTDPSQFDISFFGNDTKQGQDLLLTDITLPPNSSFLATVHIGIISGVPASTLPTDGLFDGFMAELLVPGTNLSSLAPALPFTMAEPNPAMAELGFTIK